MIMEERLIGEAGFAGDKIAMEKMGPFQRGGVLGLRPLLLGAGPRGEQRQPMLMVGGSIAASIAGLLLLMLFLLILLFVLACRPWRFFSHRRSSAASSLLKDDDIERPLFPERLLDPPDQCYDLARNIVEESGNEFDGNIYSPRTVGVIGHVKSPRKQRLVNKKRVSTDFQISTGDSLVLGVIPDSAEDVRVGQTLKRSALSNWPSEGAKHVRREDSSYDPEVIGDNGRAQVSLLKDIVFLRSSVNLEVIAGPSAGLHCSRYSTDGTMLPLILGRVSPSDIILKDSEVSGKHALIDWNKHKLKWELVDMGSLNGTFLNSKAIHYPFSGSRHSSNPVELSSGDIITVGSSSKISIQIMEEVEHELPFGVGIASDPMAMRRGGKKLPMEDMCYCRWPLPGVEKFGLFSIFDGHGGAGAAIASSKLLPQIIFNILSTSDKKARVFSCCDASDVLKEAFSLTEATLNHQYEGCTATVLLVWFDCNEEMFAQCANVGDSACILNVSEKQITMTEDHRLTSIPERTRLNTAGKPLKEGETRLCGLNLGRMLGDKFLKEQDERFCAEPYVSQVVRVAKGSTAFGILASDGLWDVISNKQAVQLVLQAKGRYHVQNENSAVRIANYVLSEAKTLRTTDNTSITLVWEVPATTLLKLTIPSPSAKEWSRFHAAANIALCPIVLLYYFSSFITMDSHLVFIIPRSDFPLWSIVLFVSICLAMVHFILEKEPPETDQTPTAVAAFMMSVVWISTMAGELLNCLSAIGTIMNLPPAILGLTILAWGNSVGDLVADVALARSGQPATAIAGCFAGPMFNMLVGLGTALVMETAKLYPEAYKLQFHVNIVIAFVFLLLTLMGSLLVVTWFRFRVPRFWGYCLMGLYLSFIALILAISVLSR